MTDQAAEQRASFLAQPFVWLEQRDIQDIRDRNVLRYLFLFFMGAVIASVAFWALQYWPSPLPDASENTRNFFEWLNGLLQNAGTEFLGAFVTFYLIETLLRKRRAEDERRDRAALQARLDEDEERRAEELKVLQLQVAAETRQQLTGFLKQQQADLDERERRRLVNQTTSMVPGFAAEAIRLLRHHDVQLTEEQMQAGEQWYSTEVLVNAVEANGDLSKVNLRGANLRGANLPGAKLEGADLRDANLQGADLRGAKLEGANLRDAGLQGADLRDAGLKGADLWRANLEGANFLGAKLEGARLLQVNLKWANLQDANLEGANLREADLQWANLPFAKLQGAGFWSADLEGANLYGVNLQGALFITIDQLRGAVNTLRMATLPDGSQLPSDDTLREAFKHWIEHTAQLKRISVFLSSQHICVVPTRTEANAELWDKWYGDGE